MTERRRALTRCRSTELEMRAPSSITHSMPIDTLGPILQSRPILALGCRITLPSISGPCASCAGALRRSDARCSCSPAGRARARRRRGQRRSTPGAGGRSTRRKGAPRRACGRTGQVVLGLADVHPVAGQREGEERGVARDQREGLLLDARRPQLDAVQHARRQHVDARVDLVAHKHLSARRGARQAPGARPTAPAPALPRARRMRARRAHMERMGARRRPPRSTAGVRPESAACAVAGCQPRPLSCPRSAPTPFLDPEPESGSASTRHTGPSSVPQPAGGQRCAPVLRAAASTGLPDQARLCLHAADGPQLCVTAVRQAAPGAAGARPSDASQRAQGCLAAGAAHRGARPSCGRAPWASPRSGRPCLRRR